jgi:hypothetical protein
MNFSASFTSDSCGFWGGEYPYIVLSMDPDFTVSFDGFLDQVYDDGVRAHATSAPDDPQKTLFI